MTTYTENLTLPDGRCWGGGNWCQPFKDLARAVVDVYAVAPYAVYLASYHIRRLSPHWLRGAEFPLKATEWLGGHEDRWIDGFKNWSRIADESGDDEGPGSKIHWNPLHSWTKRYLHFDGPIYHDAPGWHGGRLDEV